MTAWWITGDTREGTAAIPDGSIDLIVTSPPFLALRSYLPADHPEKGREIGSEPNPAMFLDVLLELTCEWRRVLAPHGSICVELGDTYSGSGGAGGDYADGGMRDGQPAFKAGKLATFKDQRGNPDGMRDTTFSGGNTRTGGGAGWPLAKSLCGIPALYTLSLIYGRNMLTGRQVEPWRVRNVIRWCRPNPPVGALGDKFRPATSEMTVACVSDRRYFDLDAVRADGPNPNTHARTARGIESRANDTKSGDDDRTGGNRSTLAIEHLGSQGAPPLDYWEIPTQPYPGAHYATFPEALVVKPIKSMCPARVCVTCGKPSERITETSYERSSGGTTGTRRNLAEPDGRTNGTGMTAKPKMATVVETLGWSDCGHNNWRQGRVLDPFAGSGTTLAVATGHGRTAIGIDLDSRNQELARDRIGPLFFQTVNPDGLADVLGVPVAADQEPTG